MASSLLGLARAMEVSVLIVRAFVRIRSALAANVELASRSDELARVVGHHGGKLAKHSYIIMCNSRESMIDRRTSSPGPLAIIVLRISDLLRLCAAPLGLLAFWVGMAAAAHRYRGGYDWRFQTISVLLYADQDPHGYLWAWAGLELCGLAGFAWATALRIQMDARADRRASGLRWLQVGFLCMGCAVLPDRLLPWSKGHEAFALLAFIGICIGVARQMALWAASNESNRHSGAMGRWRPLVCAAVPLAPLLLAGLTQAYLALALPALHWVGPDWRALGISPFLSFGLWEWMSCAVFSACMLLLWRDGWMGRQQPPRPNAPAR